MRGLWAVVLVAAVGCRPAPRIAAPEVQAQPAAAPVAAPKTSPPQTQRGPVIEPGDKELDRRRGKPADPPSAAAPAGAPDPESVTVQARVAEQKGTRAMRLAAEQIRSRKWIMDLARSDFDQFVADTGFPLGDIAGGDATIGVAWAHTDPSGLLGIDATVRRKGTDALRAYDECADLLDAGDKAGALAALRRAVEAMRTKP